MARVCPYKKYSKTEIKYEYPTSTTAKPKTITKSEGFCPCDEGACVAWDCGVCTFIEDGVGI